jgi:preprotein translocase subunit SecG
MQTVLIVVHLLVVVALIATVLLQRSEGGALGIGGGGGGGNFFSGRGQANALTRATAILATLFFITSLGLTVLATYTRSQKSIFETSAATAPASAAPEAGQAGPGFLDRVKHSVHDGLKQMEQSLESPAAADADPSKASFPDRVKQVVHDGLKQMEQALESPAASNAPAPGAATPDAGSPKGTVLDQLRQMQKNAPPPAPDTEQAPPRSR